MIIKRLTKDATTFFKVWGNEYKSIFGDSAVWVTFFITTLAVAFGYGYVYSNQVLRDIPIALVDNSQSPESRELARLLDASPQINIRPGVANFSEAEKLFYEQKACGIILIPEDFSRKILSRQHISVPLYCDASYLLTYRQTLTAAKQVLGYMNAGIQIKNLTAQGMNPALAKNAAHPVRYVNAKMYNPATGYGTFVMPSVFMIIIQSLLLTGIGILGGTMRKHHTLFYYRKFDVPALVLGKAAAYSTVGFFLFIVMLGFVYPLYSFPQRGNIIDLGVFFIPFILAISLLGLTLNLFFRHREDAVMSLLFISIPSLMLTGVSWPIQEVPPLIHYISLLLPSTLGIEGFVNINQGGTHLWEMKSLWLKMWALCGFYLLAAIVVTRTLIHQERKSLTPSDVD